MEQDEFKKLYTDIEQKLGDKYWLIRRDRAMFFIGAAVTFFAVTIGSTWLAAKAAVSGSAASQTVQQIEILRDEASASAKIIKESAQRLQSGEYISHFAGLAEGVEALYHWDKDSKRPIDDKHVGVYFGKSVEPAYIFFRKERDKGKK